MTGVGSGGDAEGDTLIRIENLTGSAFNDTLEGDGGNNVLVGGGGIDTVSYEHALAGVTVSLAVLAAQNTIGAGTDTLSGFENLTGSAFNDTLTGDANDNVLIGLAGNDILNGGAGADLMQGGSGNDTYVVDNVGDVVDETGGDGLDTVQSSVSFSLADPVHAMGAIENLTLTGSAVINGTGNDLDNVLIGNAANNVLIGLGGNDTLDGGAGADVMQGGLGNDTYVVDNAGDVVDETGGDGIDTVQSSVSFSLADPLHAMGAIENLTLTGTAAINGTGNALDNVHHRQCRQQHSGGSRRRRHSRWRGGHRHGELCGVHRRRQREPGDRGWQRRGCARRHPDPHREPDRLCLQRHAGRGRRQQRARGRGWPRHGVL